MHFTLATDESGDFEQADHGWLVVAGVLARGDLRQLDEDLRPRLRAYCQVTGPSFPPHATEIRRKRGPEGVGALLATIGAAPSVRDGFVIGVLDRPLKSADEIARALRHARFLGDLADLAGRVVAAQEGTDVKRLAFATASRSIEALTTEALTRARSVGLEVVPPANTETETGSASGRIRGVQGGLLRDALDALCRQAAGRLGPWPTLDEVIVASASGADCNAGILAADAICNTLYNLQVRDSVAVLAAALKVPEDRVLVVHRDDLFGLRAMDRALREATPDLVTAARWRARLRGDARAAPTSSRPRATREGAASMADLLWASAVERLPEHLDAREAELLAVTLHDMARLELDQKSGSYEGVWDALDAAWCGDGALARRVRDLVTRQDLAARLWRACHETANHRGDHANAAVASREFDVVYRAGPTLALVCERLEVHNLDAVRVQNRLPAASDEVDAVMLELERVSARLAETAKMAAELAELACEQLSSEEPSPVTEQDREGRLRELLGASQGVRSSGDVAVGRCFGTLARSQAFAGNWSAAISGALRARAHFGNSPFDLRFNASVLTRILCEIARTNARPAGVDVTQGLALALELMGVDVQAAPNDDTLAKRCRSMPATRFELDAMLRSSLWAPGAVPEGTRARLLKILSRGAGSALYTALSSGDCRSHPSELVARHAGELVRQAAPQAARAWFDLSIALCEQAPPGSTLQAFSTFTRALAEGRLSSDAPPNCYLNPTFEYR
ncbi:MAG: hypothetical protein OHK0013_01730 [Sandaracinaceae bacterium]